MAALELDHIIYAAPDLEGGIEEIASLTGVRAEASGSHPGRGTRNALLALGPAAYIEVLAPDPAQPAEALAGAASRIPEKARLTTWAARSDDLETAVEQAKTGGLAFGAIEPGARKRPDGGDLSWRSARGALPGDGLVPFLLQWTSAPHPSQTSPSGCGLRYFRAEHPDATSINRLLEQLGLGGLLEVASGAEPRFFLGLSTPRGEVELS